MKRCVEPFADGREAWANTVTGTIVSTKGIVVSLLFSITTMSSLPFWWPSEIRTVTFDLLTILIVITILSLLSIIYLRNRSLRSLDIKYMLHQFAHDLRDFQSKKWMHLKTPHNYRKVDFKQEYKEHLSLICGHIKEHFRRITKDDSIEVAIRLARPIKDEPDNVEYVTRFRTSGLNKNREKTTSPIPANKGLPRYLIEKGCQEILIYNDINEAVKMNLFQKTTSEEKFPNEIHTMVVCPLNAWDGSKKSMIGILYVTSRNKKTFKEEHIDTARFMGDMTASAIAFATSVYKIINKSSKWSQQ